MNSLRSPLIFTLAFFMMSPIWGSHHGINLFLNAYYTDKTLMKKEIKYIKEFSLKWVDYIISVNNFDSSLELSFIKKRELIEKYINF